MWRQAKAELLAEAAADEASDGSVPSREPCGGDEIEESLDRLMFEEDDGAAAKAILAAGRPIHIRRDDTPPGWVIRKFPDGREELVFIDISHLRRKNGGAKCQT